MSRIVAIAALLLLAAPAARADEAADLFNTKCAACHGKDGKAAKMGSPDLTKVNASQGEIEKVIADGKGKMMGYKAKLTPEQIKAVAAYVKTLK